MKLLAIVLLAASAFGQNISTGSGVVALCKNEGDPDCVTAIGSTMLKVEVGPMVVTDGFREIARIDKDGKVTVADGVTAEYVIRMMGYYWQANSKRDAEQYHSDLQRCFDGWKHTQDVWESTLPKPKVKGSKRTQ